MQTIAVLGLLVALSVPGATALAGETPPGEGPCAVEPLEEAAAADVAPVPAAEAEPEMVVDYDPWEPFNERMFWFNHSVLDRFLVKPAARGWSTALPGVARRRLDNAFENLEMPRRFVNNMLQLRPYAASKELTRFVLNTSIGIIGLFDVAGHLHIAGTDADAGQTLGLYGIGAGPYLVLPFMRPLTVRDGIGSALDGLLDPVGRLLPFVANQTLSLVKTVNDRSLDLELYEDVEDSMLDVYSAARNVYLQRRRRAIENARADRG